MLQDNGAYTSWGATYPTVMMLPATSLYRVPNVRFDATLVYTNNTYCQAMRGYGNPEVTWAIESNLDELAEAAGIDPLRAAADQLQRARRDHAHGPQGHAPAGCGSASTHRSGWAGGARRGPAQGERRQRRREHRSSAAAWAWPR